jgi:hypothetical protein
MMKDDELITAVKESVTNVHMNIPVEQIVKRSRSLRARRLIPGGAAAVAVAAGAALAGTALAGTALTPPGQQASRQPTPQLAAWTVSKLADANISVTIRRLADPAGLQRTLRADGVPASVTFTSRQNPACRAYPGGTAPPTGPVGTPLLDRVFPGSYQPLHIVPTPRPTTLISPNTVFLLIDPSALPGNAGVKIAVDHYAGRGPLISESPAVVYASPRCTGS